MQKFQIGQQLGIYKLIRFLGEGADGHVWEVVTDNNRHFALKICKNTKSFLNEFEHLRKLNIPGIVRVYDYHEEPDLLYYTMDIAYGVDVRSYLEQFEHEKTRYSQCVYLLEVISSILSELHTYELIHFDIKPENILVNNDGTVTIIDFGRVASLGEKNPAQRGSLIYMSPEQRMQFPCTTKSDVYSFAVLAYELLSGKPPPYTKIGEIWPSLIHVSKHIHIELAGYIQKCLHIPPTLRPTMRLFRDTIRNIQQKNIRVQSFPISPTYIGKCPNLLDASHMIVGTLGSGRKRIIVENIRLAYNDGIQSFVGFGSPLHPFQPWIQILESMLFPMKLKERQQIIRNEHTVLRQLIPDLVDSRASVSPQDYSPKSIAEAIAKILQRVSPVAIILFDFEKCDLASVQITQHIWQYSIPGVSLWLESTESLPWADTIHPPTWDASAETELLQTLIPSYIQAPISAPGNTPLQSSIKAWQIISRYRREPHINQQISNRELAPLSLLTEPFLRKIAETLHPDIEGLLENNVLQICKRDLDGEWLEFTFYPQKLLVQQAINITQTQKHWHRLVAEAWQHDTNAERKLDTIIYHLVLGESISPKHLVQALWQSIKELDSLVIARWLLLCQIHGATSSSFPMQYAPALVQLVQYKQPPTEYFASLRRGNLNKLENSLIDYLEILQAIHQNDHQTAITIGERLIRMTNTQYPRLALAIYRELAWLYLALGNITMSISLCERALANMGAIEIFPQMALSIHVTLSAALSYKLDLVSSVQTCKRGLEATKNLLHMSYYQGALMVNQCIAEYQQGLRQQSRETIHNIRQLLEQHDSLAIRAHCILYEARMKIESGKAAQNIEKIHEAINIGRVLQDTEFLAECFSVLLDAATQIASAKEANKAMQEYSNLYPPTQPILERRDHFPAALARWYWLSGNIEQSLQALQEKRVGFGYYLVVAESIRMNIIVGNHTTAQDMIHTLLQDSHTQQLQDVHLFVQLCHAALQGNISLLSQDIPHEWVEIYVGRLHLLAIQQKLHSHDISQTLSTLYLRAKATEHQLFQALGNTNAW